MVKLKEGEYYWYRIGDSDDYNKTKKISNLKSKLKHCGELTSIRTYGIETTRFQGNNYISLFIGDSEAQPIRSIPKATIRKLIK